MINALLNLLPVKWQHNLRIWNMKRHRNAVIEQWEKEGKPLPPPHTIKQLAIEHYQKKYNVTTLVETGTYLGDMVMSQKNNFRRIISIELGKDLWEKAKQRFRMYNHIELLQGDSGKVLHEVINNINEQAIFWLDGHYSSGITAKGEKECPIYEELAAIFKNNHKHILLIDDARHFVGQGDYPTAEEVATFISQKSSDYKYEIKDDIICFEPKT